MTPLQKILQEVERLALVRAKRDHNEAFLSAWDSQLPLLAAVRELSSALEFYAGKSKDAQWDGAMLMGADKFGCLDKDLSGPLVADQALSRAAEIMGGKG